MTIAVLDSRLQTEIKRISEFNSINIFHYFKPWQVFNLNPQTATTEDILSQGIKDNNEGREKGNGRSQNFSENRTNVQKFNYGS